MDKEMFRELTKSLKEAAAISRKDLKPSRKFIVEVLDVKETRQKTGLSQTMFAQLIGVKLKTLQNWEQHRRHPSGAAGNQPGGDAASVADVRAAGQAVPAHRHRGI